MRRRVLIVNADDFGRSPGVNRGVIRGHEEGIVTSASLMVRWPAAKEAAEYARRSDTLGVGLHLDLGEWEYRDDDWRARYLVVEEESAETASAEIARQLDLFEGLVGRPPTHLDSHQHVHNSEPTRSAMLAAGERLGVPVRAHAPGISYCGVFYGQDGRGFPVPEAIEVDALVGAIESLRSGVTELACHPAAEADHESTYDQERLTELETLCHERVQEAIERCRIELRSFADLEP